MEVKADKWRKKKRLNKALSRKKKAGYRRGMKERRRGEKITHN